MKRGFILPVCLILLSLMLIMGMAFLARRISQQRAAQRQALVSQARSMAESGLEDARGKFEKDLRFPPDSAASQANFSYSEDMLDSAGARVGSYEVHIDSTYVTPPYFLYRIKSTGLVGPRDAPLAVSRIYAELDVCSIHRTLTNQTNPQFYRFVNWQDQSSL